MIYLYAITRHSEKPLPGVLGLENEPLKRIQIHQIDAIVSRCTSSQHTPTTASLWMHEGVVEALMKEQCTLPVCYGTCLENEGALEHALHAGHDAMVADLERLNGYVELGLRVMWVRKEVQEETDLTGSKAKRIHDTLLEILSEGKYQVHSEPLPMMTGAYLVKKEHLYRVQKTIGELRKAYPSSKFLCTGPWPPYHFVTPAFSLVPVN